MHQAIDSAPRQDSPSVPLGLCPWTNVYGLARSLLAFSTLLTLTWNDVDVLFRPLGNVASPTPGSLAQLGLFALFGEQRLALARNVAVAILVTVIIGWRPRLTGILHWWVTASFAAACVPVEGGDQVSAILCLLLVPVSLTDNRKWHWEAPRAMTNSLIGDMATAVAASCLGMIRFQVAVIYFFACIAKFGVQEWTNGTALYYWLVHPVFGLSPAMLDLSLPLLARPTVIMLLTWGGLAMEALLFMGLLMEKRLRPRLLGAGLGFHFGICVAHGLLTFSMAMAGALVLYLRDSREAFRVPAMLLRLARSEEAVATGALPAGVND